jgi:hypothetical protein
VKAETEGFSKVIEVENGCETLDIVLCVCVCTFKEGNRKRQSGSICLGLVVCAFEWDLIEMI